LSGYYARHIDSVTAQPAEFSPQFAMGEIILETELSFFVTRAETAAQ